MDSYSKFCHNLHMVFQTSMTIFFVDNKKVIPKNTMFFFFFIHTLEQGPMLIWTPLAFIV